MTTKADTPPTVDAVLANLQQQLADLGDPREIERVRDAFYAQEAILSWRIDAIRTGTWNVAQAEAAIPDVERWFNFLTEARRTLCDELAAMPSRIYDERTLGRQQNVKLSILKIDRDVDTDPWCLESLRVGDLLRAAGYVEGPKIENQVVGKLPWHGSLPEAERRLTKLRLDLADAQARLKNALMSDEERAAEAAEVARRNALPVRKTRGDGSRYDLWPDGRIVEVDATV